MIEPVRSGTGINEELLRGILVANQLAQIRRDLRDELRAVSGRFQYSLAFCATLPRMKVIEGDKSIVLADQIVESMRQKPSEELLAIWMSNDRDQWSDAAYEAICHVLSERGVTVPPQKVFAPPPPRYRGVRGWLLFFCISLTIISPLATVAQLRVTIESESRLFDLHPGLRVMVLLDIALAAFGMYAGICLWRVALGAVKKVKLFLWCKLAYLVVPPPIILLFIARLPMNGATISELMKEVALPVISFLIPMAYLSQSKRVKATYL